MFWNRFLDARRPVVTVRRVRANWETAIMKVAVIRLRVKLGEDMAAMDDCCATVKRDDEE